MNLPEHDPPSQSEQPDIATEPLTPKPAFTIASLFFGADGLRAVWGIFLYLILRELLIAGLKPLLSAFTSHSNGSIFTPSRLLVYEGVALFSILVASWIMAKVELRPMAAYGLGGLHRLRNFFTGLLWGVALLSLLVFSLRATGLLVFDVRLLFGANAIRYGALWLAGFLLVGIYEEYFFRGYLQFTLSRGLSAIYRRILAQSSQSEAGLHAAGFWSAALLLSFGFGFIHRTNAGESPVGLLAAALIAVVFCLSLWRTGSLWWAVGFHAAWDWAQSFLYGVADSGIVIQGHLVASHPIGQPIFSGGLTGPEGSLYILPIIALAAVVIHLTLPQAQDDATPKSMHTRTDLD